MNRLVDIIESEHLLVTGETVNNLTAPRHDVVFEAAMRKLFDMLDIDTGRNEDLAYSTIYVSLVAQSTTNLQTGTLKRRFREVDIE